MKANELISDACFQVNLLLWMTLEQPREEFIICPFFHTLGFGLFQVERQIPLPVPLVEAVEASGLEISTHPEPELVLLRKADGKALVFEAKKKAFLYQSPTTGQQTTNNKQARGLLLVAGPAFGEIYPKTAALLVYSIPKPGRKEMEATLDTLASELKGKKLKPAAFSVAEIALSKGQLLFVIDESFATFAGCPKKAVVLSQGLTDDMDPSPLYLLDDADNFPDPEQQDRCRHIFMRKVQGRMLSILHHSPAEGIVLFDAEMLLADVTENVSTFMGNTKKKALLRLIRERVFKHVSDRCLAKPDLRGCVSLNSNALTVSFASSDERRAFLDWFEDISQTRFDAAVLPEEQKELPFGDDGSISETTPKVVGDVPAAGSCDEVVAPLNESVHPCHGQAKQPTESTETQPGKNE